MEEILEKYSNIVIKNLNKEKISKIILFLEKEKCDYIEDILEDYLDLFSFEYEFFVNKYNKLNKKYNGKFLELASSDMNLFEEFYD